MQGILFVRIFVPYKIVSVYECRQCEIADAQRDARIVHPAAAAQRGCVCFRYQPEAEGSQVECGVGDALSLAYKVEERRVAFVRVGGIHARASPKVLQPDGRRSGVLARIGKCLGRTFRYGESFKEQY